MNQMNSINSSGINSDSISRIESALDSTVTNFENAVDRLVDKIHDTRETLDQWAEMTERPKQEIIQMEQMVKKVLQEVRTNPTAYLWVGLGFLASAVFVRYFSKTDTLAMPMTTASMGGSSTILSS